MADHMLYTPENLSTSTLAAVRNRSTLARLVHQDFNSDFAQGRGERVNVKRPIMIDKARKYTAADRAAKTAISYSTLVEPFTSVTLNTQVYNAVKLPDDFMTFTLRQMEKDVVAPMAESVAEAINQIVVDAFESVPAGLTEADQAAEGTIITSTGTTKVHTSLEDVPDEDKPNIVGFGVGTTVKVNELKANDNESVMRVIRAAHRLLNERGVPKDNRYLVLGSSWEGALLSQPNLFKVNEAGTDGLLRESTLGKLHGFTIVTDYAIDATTAYAFHRDAVTLVTRTTRIPQGAAFASSVSSDGFSLRYLHDYDPDHLTDRAVIDTFAGAEVVQPQMIVKLEGAEGMEEPAAPKE